MLKNLEALEKSIAAFSADLPKVKEKGYGWKAAALRMRKESRALGALLKEFRKASVAEAEKE